MSYRYADSLRAGSGWNRAPSWSCSQAVGKPVCHIPLLCLQWKTPDDGQRNCPKHVECHSKNKFEKLVHLVGFIVRKIFPSETLVSLLSICRLAYAKQSKVRFTHSMPCPCRAHTVLLPCRAAKALECVFPFDLHSAAVSDTHLPCHAHAMLWPCRSSQGHGTAWPSRDGHAVPWPWEEGHGQSMAWARHGKCESDTAAMGKSNGKDTL